VNSVPNGGTDPETETPELNPDTREIIGSRELSIAYLILEIHHDLSAIYNDI
jgi:hypothetical protein